MNKLRGIRAPKKIATGIEGLEHITMSGLTEGRATLVGGSSGSGKTLLAAEFLYRGITEFDRNGVSGTSARDRSWRL
jgi:circadian clock protein KaiC